MATLFTGKGFPLGVLEELMVIRCIHGATGAPGDALELAQGLGIMLAEDTTDHSPSLVGIRGHATRVSRAAG